MLEHLKYSHTMAYSVCGQGEEEEWKQARMLQACRQSVYCINKIVRSELIFVFAHHPRLYISRTE